MSEQHKYFNFKKGGVEVHGNKTKYVPKGLPSLLTEDEILKKPRLKDQEYYMSIYKYTDGHKHVVTATGSVANISDVVTDRLVWDFDGTDLEQTRQDAVTLGTRLVNDYNIDPDDIRCYFSGAKGLHIEVSLGKDINVNQFKAAVNTIAKDLKTFDTSVCDYARMFRVPNSVNRKSGLFKIPLHIAEVDELNMDQIKAMAKEPRNINTTNKPVVLPESIFVVKEKEQKVDVEINDEEFNPKTTPRGWKDWAWALAQGYFEGGERHNALLILASRCRGLGYDKEQTYYLCKSALEKQAKRTNTEPFSKQELWEDIIQNTVYSEKWNGGQFSIKNNPWLQKYCAKMNLNPNSSSNGIVQLHDVESEFIDYVKNIEKNTILTGIPELDEALPLTVGMNLGILGAASSGKTALSLKILENTSKAGVISVFASLDMRRNRLFEKLLYRVSGLPRDKLYEKIKNNEAGDIFKIIKEKYKNVYFYDRSCPTVDDIRSYINDIEDETGQKVKLVMVDYFERVNADKSDETAASKEVAGKLQDLVNDLNVCLITLVQPNKFSLGGGPDTPILNYTAIKGSSYLYQAFRSIISIWRPFFTPETKDNDKYLQMAILKNDLGELDVFHFGWDGKRGEIWGLLDEEIEEMNELLDKKNQAKKAKESDGWS